MGFPSWVQTALVVEKQLEVVIGMEPFGLQVAVPHWELGPCLPRPTVGRVAIASFAFSAEVLEGKTRGPAKEWAAVQDDWPETDNESAFQGAINEIVVVVIDNMRSCLEVGCDGWGLT